MDEKQEFQRQETMPEYCNVCGSLKIQQTDNCELCGSLKRRDHTTTEDGSGHDQPLLKKRETSSGQDHRLHSYGFSVTPVPPVPAAFYTSICRSCSDVVNSPALQLPKPSSSSQKFDVMINPNFPPLLPSQGSSSLSRCLSDVLPVGSPPRTGVVYYDSGELAGPSSSKNFPCSPECHPTVTPPSPSPVKGGSTLWPPLSVLQRSFSDPVPVVSLPRTGVMPTGSPVITQESPDPAKGSSTQWPPLPVLQRSVSDPVPVSSPPRTGVMPTESPVMTHESPDPAKGSSMQWPPLPVLQRPVSDPVPVSSPPRTGVMPTESPVMTHESPDLERFKRMAGRIKEMKQLWETVVLEAEGTEPQNNNATATEGSDIEEEVSIEKDGEYIRIYMKCPCSKAYQLLISGSHCYYKLM